MAKLRFLYATMESGKSLQAISAAYNYTKKGMNVVVFTSIVDTRSEKNTIESRIGLTREAISLSKEDNPLEIVKSMPKLPSCVIVDEVQFMERHHIWEFSDIVDELNIPVICIGLRSDYRGKIFPAAEELFVLSDEIEEIKGICWCGEGPRMHLRVIDGKVVKEGEQVNVGDAEYIAVCRLHWKQGIFENPDQKTSQKT